MEVENSGETGVIDDTAITSHSDVEPPGSKVVIEVVAEVHAHDDDEFQEKDSVHQSSSEAKSDTNNAASADDLEVIEFSDGDKFPSEITSKASDKGTYESSSTGKKCDGVSVAEGKIANVQDIDCALEKTPTPDVKHGSQVSISITSIGADNDVHKNGDISKHSDDESADKNDDQVEDKKSKSKKDGESKKKKRKTCAECGEKKPIQFRLHYQGQTHKLCSDTCYQDFKLKTQQKAAVDEKCAICSKVHKFWGSGKGFYPSVGEIMPLCSEACLKEYQDDHEPPRKCSHCEKGIKRNSPEVLNWETMRFCNEDCLGKYQSLLGSHCTSCQTPVPQASLGKYCVCFGSDIRQFCSGNCLHDFKKGLKVCTFCQTDLSNMTDNFMAPVGEKNQFKEFCSPQCMERFEIMNNMTKSTPPSVDCASCKKSGKYRTQVKHKGDIHFFCSDVCIAGFRYQNKIKDIVCLSCYKFFIPKSTEPFTLNLDDYVKCFCAKSCMTLYVLSNRKITQCVSCKVKKYNFDMIEAMDSEGESELLCSLNCLSVQRANSGSAQMMPCAHCGKTQQSQYHLTMADGMIKSFCSYQCMLMFQTPAGTVQTINSTASGPQVVNVASLKTSSAPNAVIADVASLNQHTRSSTPTIKNLISQPMVPVRSPGATLTVISPKSQVSTNLPTNIIATNLVSPKSREVIVKPRAPKAMRNKRIEVKPLCLTKAIDSVPKVCDKAVQTDDNPRPIILPVPIPIFVPTPFHMYSRPVPTPVPFPVPIPFPLMLPATSSEMAIMIAENIKKSKEQSSQENDLSSLDSTEQDNIIESVADIKECEDDTKENVENNYKRKAEETDDVSAKKHKSEILSSSEQNSMDIEESIS